MKRTNQEYGQWIKRVESAFTGPNGIIGEDSQAFKRNEREMAAIAPMTHSRLHLPNGPTLSQTYGGTAWIRNSHSK